MTKVFYSLLFLSVFILTINFSFGQNRRHTKNNHNKKHVRVIRSKRVLKSIPSKHVIVVHNKKKYHQHSGNYYVLKNNQYSLVYPPKGFRVRFLPVGNRVVFVNSKKHYYYKGLFYYKIGQEYEVVEPQLGTLVPELPETNLTPELINGKKHYEYNSILYETVETAGGVQYRVVEIYQD